MQAAAQIENASKAVEAVTPAIEELLKSVQALMIRLEPILVHMEQSIVADVKSMHLHNPFHHHQAAHLLPTNSASVPVATVPATVSVNATAAAPVSKQ